MTITRRQLLGAAAGLPIAGIAVRRVTITPGPLLPMSMNPKLEPEKWAEFILDSVHDSLRVGTVTVVLQEPRNFGQVITFEDEFDAYAVVECPYCAFDVEQCKLLRDVQQVYLMPAASRFARVINQVSPNAIAVYSMPAIDDMEEPHSKMEHLVKHGLCLSWCFFGSNSVSFQMVLAFRWKLHTEPFQCIGEL